LKDFSGAESGLVFVDQLAFDENLAEDADHHFFSRIHHDENHVLHPLLPERNDRGYELRRR